VVLYLQDGLDHTFAQQQINYYCHFNQAVTHIHHDFDYSMMSTINVRLDQFSLMEVDLSLSMHVRRNIFYVFYSK
jgi:hypothetical protein